MLEWLENWYNSQCNGDWEHYHVIKIESLDNPGWSITVDISEIIEKVEVEKIDWNIIGDFEDKWIGYKFENNIFKASGSPKNLNLLIYILKQLIENKSINQEEIIAKIK